MKKREKYNTIIVDNDKRKKIEAINSRDKEEVAGALQKFTKIETITRDFSQTYKNAANETHPNAKQIVDRFHIFKNLTDDLLEYIKRTIKDRVKIVDLTNINAKETSEDGYLNKRDRDKQTTALKKWELIQEVQKLKKEGKNNSEISRLMELSRYTIIDYLKLTQPPVADRNCILDEYIPMIKKLIINGAKTDEIYQEIKEAGYKGKTSLLNSKLKGIRLEIKNNTKYLKRSKIKKLLYRPLDEIKDEDTRKALTEYLLINHELNVVIEMVRRFKEITFSKKPETLDDWIDEARSLGIAELSSFTNLLKSDIDAVKNAIIYTQYSNGPTEGFNNKTKVIKRQMYGRCGFSLLRLKVLA